MKNFDRLKTVTQAAVTAQEKLDDWTDLKCDETPEWSVMRTLLDAFSCEAGPKVVQSLIGVVEASLILRDHKPRKEKEIMELELILDEKIRKFKKVMK